MSLREDYKKSEVFKEPEIRGELSIEELVQRQVERTNISASYDVEVFESNVRTLKSLLPQYKRTEVDSREKEYTQQVRYYKYHYNCGIKVGTPENPIKGSPTLVEEAQTNYNKLFEIILDAFDECGISWKIEGETIVFGRVPGTSDKPTPVFVEDKKKEKIEHFKS